MKSIFNALDASHTEEVHYCEFLAAMCTSRFDMHEDLILQVFRRFDTDKSGRISLENLREIFGNSWDHDLMEEILAEVPNQDGEIEYTEFIRYLRDQDSADDERHLASRIIDAEISSRDPARRMASRSHMPALSGAGGQLNGKSRRPSAHAQVMSKVCCCRAKPFF